LSWEIDMADLAIGNLGTLGLEAVLPPTRHAHPTGFQDLLAAATAAASATDASAASPAAKVLVQRGDCLSKICAEALRAKQGTYTPRELHAAVQAVAKANQIANPNKIYAGQKLDLAALGALPVGSGSATQSAGQESAGKWKSLVDGAVTVTSEFGRRKDPFTGHLAQHEGIDVAAPSGSPIAAFAAGSVVYSGWKSGYGNTVILHHPDGLESVYGHVSKSLVRVGDEVASHETIAQVGSAGRATGAHLHFEVRRDGKAVNPATVLNADPAEGL
jgi:murein DD-endopeptidase MepM/ murein hydrolase activator NlpD